MTPTPPQDPAESWFDRLVATTELSLRRGMFGYAPQGPMEKYVLERRLAGKLRTLECPHCKMILQLLKPVEDGQIITCPACYGCYDIQVHQHGRVGPRGAPS